MGIGLRGWLVPQWEHFLAGTECSAQAELACEVVPGMWVVMKPRCPCPRLIWKSSNSRPLFWVAMTVPGTATLDRQPPVMPWPGTLPSAGGGATAGGAGTSSTASQGARPPAPPSCGGGVVTGRDLVTAGVYAFF